MIWCNYVWWWLVNIVHYYTPPRVTELCYLTLPTNKRPETMNKLAYRLYKYDFLLISNNTAAISNVNTISIPVDLMDGHHHHHDHNHLGLQGHLPSTASTTSCYSTGSQWPHHWCHIVDKMRMLYEWLEVDSKLDWTASMSTHQSTNISKTH